MLRNLSRIVLLPLVLAAVPMTLLAAPGAAAGQDPLDGHLAAVVAAGVPGLAVVVVREGAVDVRTAGDGDDAPRQVASLSKAMTATAVLQLVERDRLALDDPVVRHLPEFAPADDRAGQVTVRQLLNHSSGLRDDVLGFDQYAPGPTTSADAVALVRRSRLAYDPGTDFDYCNVNYWVAGRLVEVVSGESLPDYLARHVFEPLGMTRTHLALRPGLDAAAGRTHSVAYGRSVHLAQPGWFAGGAGGVVSTAADLGRWLAFQQGAVGHDVLAPTLLAESHRRQSPAMGYRVGYALGWWQGESAAGGSERLSHGGAGPGMSAYAGVFPDGVAVGVLLDSAAVPADRIGNDLHDLATGAGTPAAPSTQGPWLDVVATGVTLLAAAAAVRAGVTRPGPGRWRAALRVLAVVLGVGLLVLPALGSRLVLRQATWRVFWHAAPVATVATLVIAGSLVAGGLISSWRAIRRGRPPADRRGPAAAGPVRTHRR